LTNKYRIAKGILDTIKRAMLMAAFLFHNEQEYVEYGDRESKEDTQKVPKQITPLSCHINA
jgi:hypothetical protein